MQAHLTRYPAEQRAEKIAEFQSSLNKGELLLSDYYISLANDRRKSRFHNSVQKSITGGIVCGVVAMAATGAIFPAVAVGGLVVVAGGYFAKSGSDAAELYIEEGDWAEFLTEKEVKELAGLVKAVAASPPKNDRALKSFQQAQTNLLGVVEFEEGDEDAAVITKTIEAVAEPVAETVSDAEPWDKLLARAIALPVVSIVGPQGTYKTTLLNYLVGLLSQSKDHGRVVVLDPHAKKSDWPGCQVIGRGMQYKAIENELSNAMAVTRNRYELRANADIEDFSRITYVCEELTNWAEHVGNVAEFSKSSLSDFRKANQQVIKVAHGETNTAQGGSKGTAKMRGEGEVKIKLTAPGKGTIKFPGDDPMPFSFPDLRPLTAPPSAQLDELQPTAVAIVAEPVDKTVSMTTPSAPPMPAELEKNPLAVELGNSGKTVGSFLDAIVRYCHKHPGKLRGAKTISNQCFSENVREVADLHMESMLSAIAQNFPESFKLSGPKAIICYAPKDSPSEYYEGLI